MNINELFDRPARYTIINNGNSYYAYTNINGTNYLMQYDFAPANDKHASVGSVNFATQTDNTMTMQRTGTGNEIKIFGTVIDFTKKCVEKTNPDVIMFTADPNDAGRNSLYTKMIQILSRGTDYRVTNSENGLFRLDKRESQQNQTLPQVPTLDNSRKLRK